MNYFLRLLIALAVLIKASLLCAETTLCYVDIPAASNEELEVKQFVNDFAARDKALEEKQKKARAIIEPKIAALQKLTDAARAAEEAKLSAEIGKLQEDFSKESEKIKAEYEKGAKDLREKNRLLASALRKENNCDVLFENVVIDASDKIKNLTGKLVEKYNKTYKPAPPAKASGTKAPAKTPPTPKK